MDAEQHYLQDPSYRVYGHLLICNSLRAKKDQDLKHFPTEAAWREFNPILEDVVRLTMLPCLGKPMPWGWSWKKRMR